MNSIVNNVVQPCWTIDVVATSWHDFQQVATVLMVQQGSTTSLTILFVECNSTTLFTPVLNKLHQHGIFSVHSRLRFSAIHRRRIWRFAFYLLVLILHKTAADNMSLHKLESFCWLGPTSLTGMKIWQKPKFEICIKFACCKFSTNVMISMIVIYDVMGLLWVASRASWKIRLTTVVKLICQLARFVTQSSTIPSSIYLSHLHYHYGL